jgi:hypothetical protein
MVGEISEYFSPKKFHLSLLGFIASCGREDTWRPKMERPELEGRESGLQSKPAGCVASEAYASGPDSEEEEEEEEPITFSSTSTFESDISEAFLRIRNQLSFHRYVLIYLLSHLTVFDKATRILKL